MAYSGRRRGDLRAPPLVGRALDLPEINLGHLRAMTDSTGMLQHADYNIPCFNEGYCLDDNARALLLTALLDDSGAEQPAEARALSTRYLAFISHAYNPATGRFRNVMSYARHWLEDCGSEDSHGRALWALGAVVGRSFDPGCQGLASQLFHTALPAVLDFTSPRAWAFALLGIAEYLRAFKGDSSVQSLQIVLAGRLMTCYRSVRVPGWNWFETSVTYSNARIPQSLIAVGTDIGNSEMVAVGLDSLSWLVREQTSQDGHFAPIGSNGFWVRGEEKPAFDQQPLEASAMVSACLEAARATGDVSWLAEARRAFHWFLGENHLHQALYDDSTGGCRDGLHRERPNQNQGAETTLSFLLALLEMRAADRSA